MKAFVISVDANTREKAEMSLMKAFNFFTKDNPLCHIVRILEPVRHDVKANVSDFNKCYTTMTFFYEGELNENGSIS